MLHRMDVTRPRSVVGWTVLLGALAGLIVAVYHTVAAEPAIDEAIAIEEAGAAAGGDSQHAHNAGDTATGDGHSHGDGEDEQVSRGTQRGVGLFAAFALTGAAFGLLLAVAALALRGSWLTPFSRFLIAGGVLAGAQAIAPWLKYPPNPPAVGDPGTAGERQLTYWLLVALAGVILAGVAHLSGRLRHAGWEDSRRTAAVALAAMLAMGLLLVVMPASTATIPAEMPASLIWRFRTASLVGNLLLWGLLTVGTAVLVSEAARRSSALSTATASPASTATSDA